MSGLVAWGGAALGFCPEVSHTTLFSIHEGVTAILGRWFGLQVQRNSELMTVSC